MKDRYIIACSGMASRWNSHMGIPKKQLIEIDGETLLDRTIRLLRENLGNPNIYIMALEDEHKSKFEKPNTVFFNPILNKRKHRNHHRTNHSISSAEPIWNKQGDTVVLFGDVFYSENAIAEISKNISANIRFYGRKNRPLTKFQTPHDEIFAVRFTHNIHEQIFHSFNKLYSENRRIIAWDLFWYWNPMKLNEFYNKEYQLKLEWMEINDWTDDFDLPEDYDIFIEQWNFLKKCKIRK